MRRFLIAAALVCLASRRVTLRGRRPGCALGAAAEQARRAWFAHDAAGAGRREPPSDGPAPGADPSAALEPAQAAALIADFLASAQEVETVVRAAGRSRGAGLCRAPAALSGVRHPGRAEPESAAGIPAVGSGWLLVELRVVS